MSKLSATALLLLSALSAPCTVVVQLRQHRRSPPKLKLGTLLLLSLFASPAALYAAGFDGEYTAHTGDLDNNGLTDIYLKRRTELVFVSVGDILTPIVTAQREVGEFYLQNFGNGQFDIVPLSASDLATVSQWPEEEGIAVVQRHLNFDPAVDVQLVGVRDVIAGALDQMIFADRSNFGQPVSISAMDEDLQRFLFDTFAWSIDVNYFRDNAPWRIVGVDPGTGSWQSAILDPTNLFLINDALTRCEINTGDVCVVSNVDPSPCVRSVTIRNEFGEIIRVATVDVCIANVHVYAYTPGSILVEQDFSVFNQDARDVAEEIEDYSPGGLEDILGEMTPIDWEALEVVLREILRGVFGDEPLDEVEEEEYEELAAQLCLDIGADKVNSFVHAPFPLDESFPESDPTFHHYDVMTKACSGGEANCSNSVFMEQVLPKFSYPSRRLRPTNPTFDPGDLVLVYVAPPRLISYPWAYEIPFGYIVQRILDEGDVLPEYAWQLGAIQNITTVAHAVYPGTISRVMTSGTSSSPSPNPYFFTHGIGLNRAGTTIKEWLDVEVPSQAINMMLGCANDVWGAWAFRALDKQAIKYWQENVASAPLGFAKPLLQLSSPSAEYSAE